MYQNFYRCSHQFVNLAYMFIILAHYEYSLSIFQLILIFVDIKYHEGNMEYFSGVLGKVTDKEKKSRKNGKDYVHTK